MLVVMLPMTLPEKECCGLAAGLQLPAFDVEATLKEVDEKSKPLLEENNDKKQCQ
jgi:hypothetical protein